MSEAAAHPLEGIGTLVGACVIGFGLSRKSDRRRLTTRSQPRAAARNLKQKAGETSSPSPPSTVPT